MAVRDDVIAWLGSDAVGRNQFPDAQIVELAGDFVAPAFVDTHVHLTATGLRLTGGEPGHPLTRAQRDQARRAALDAAAAAGIVAVHECTGPNRRVPDTGGAQDWQELRELRHGVEVVGYWGEAVRTAAQARALVEDTGVRGLAGNLFVDGDPERTGTSHLDPLDHMDVAAITDHLMACTEAGISAGFHLLGESAVAAVVDAFDAVVRRFGAPATARCGHRLEHLDTVTPEQAAQLGSWGVIASMQPAGLGPLALLASAGVPLAFGSDSPCDTAMTCMDPWSWVRAASNQQAPGSAISARAAFAAATRGAWRAGGVRDGITGTLVPGAPASYAVWETGELALSAPDDAVQRWSTDRRSRVPALPRLDPADPSPRCRQTVHRGVTLYG